MYSSEYYEVKYEEKLNGDKSEGESVVVER